MHGNDPVEIGRKGGRPRNPTVGEARALKLEELVPKALNVLEESLGSTDKRVKFDAARDVLDRAWGRAAQTVHQGTEIPPGASFAELTAAQRKTLLARVEERMRELENGGGKAA